MIKPIRLSLYETLKKMFDEEGTKPLVSLDTDIVEAIYANKKSKVVVVKFKNGDKEIIKCSKDDDFDVTVGVALAISRHIFGSHAKFYKNIVEAKTTYVEDKKPKKINNKKERRK